MYTKGNECILYPPKSLCVHLAVLPTFPCPSPTPRKPLIRFVSLWICVRFLKSYTHGTYSSCVWFLSLRIIISSRVYQQLVPLIAAQLSSSWYVYCNLFIHSSTDAQFSFQFSTMTNKTAINIHLEVFVLDVCFLFSRVNAQAWSGGVIGFNLRNCQTFPKWLYHFTLPP